MKILYKFFIYLNLFIIASLLFGCEVNKDNVNYPILVLSNSIVESSKDSNIKRVTYSPRGQKIFAFNNENQLIQLNENLTIKERLSINEIGGNATGLDYNKNILFLTTNSSENRHNVAMIYQLDGEKSPLLIGTGGYGYDRDSDVSIRGTFHPNGIYGHKNYLFVAARKSQSIRVYERNKIFSSDWKSSNEPSFYLILTNETDSKANINQISKVNPTKDGWVTMNCFANYFLISLGAESPIYRYPMKAMEAQDRHFATLDNRNSSYVLPDKVSTEMVSSFDFGVKYGAVAVGNNIYLYHATDIASLNFSEILLEFPISEGNVVQIDGFIEELNSLSFTVVTDQQKLFRYTIKEVVVTVGGKA